MQHGESKGKTGHAERLCARKRWPYRSTFAKRLLNDPTKTAEGGQKYKYLCSYGRAPAFSI